MGFTTSRSNTATSSNQSMPTLETSPSTAQQQNPANKETHSLASSIFKSISRVKSKITEICSRSLNAFSASGSSSEDDNFLADGIRQIYHINNSNNTSKRKLQKTSKTRNTVDDSYYGEPFPREHGRAGSGSSKLGYPSVPFFLSSSKTISLPSHLLCSTSTCYPSRNYSNNKSHKNSKNFKDFSWKECEKIVNGLFAEKDNSSLTSEQINILVNGKSGPITNVKNNKLQNRPSFLHSINISTKPDTTGLENNNTRVDINTYSKRSLSEGNKNNASVNDTQIDKNSMDSPTTISNSSFTTHTQKTQDTNKETLDNNNNNNNNTVASVAAGDIDSDNIESDDELEADECTDDEANFDTFDVYAEVAKLRNDPSSDFISGYPVWEKRRELQYKKYPINVNKDYDSLVNFRKVPEKAYYQVYEKLIVKNNPLKSPINLRDLIKVINVGWIVTRKYEEAAAGGSIV
ncbi:hypothetical protein ACO0RG_002058 [Hanseniaspora osmophila]